MTNFVLIYSGGGMPESEEEQGKVMAAWGAWYEKMGAAVVDGGNPFSMSKHVSASGTADGAASSPPATGYTIISADSLDDAVAKVQDHPHVHVGGGEVSVYETFQM
ncbi:MAG: hypothetical protein AAF702_41395 [Chloroflexota bacterium]